jgi:hypothetical protein
MTKILQQTINLHVMLRFAFSRFQLSYSHMQPIGWKDNNVPSKAPISETNPLKTGIPLATR